MTVFNQTIFIAAPNGQVQKVEYRNASMSRTEKVLFEEKRREFLNEAKRRKATA